TQAQIDSEFDPGLTQALKELPIPLTTRPDLPIASALYRSGDDLFYEARIPASVHASARQVELFLETHADLAFRQSQTTVQSEGSIWVKVPAQVKDGHQMPTHTKLSFVLTGLGK